MCYVIEHYACGHYIRQQALGSNCGCHHRLASGRYTYNCGQQFCQVPDQSNDRAQPSPTILQPGSVSTGMNTNESWEFFDNVLTNAFTANFPHLFNSTVAYQFDRAVNTTPNTDARTGGRIGCYILFYNILTEIFRVLFYPMRFPSLSPTLTTENQTPQMDGVDETRGEGAQLRGTYRSATNPSFQRLTTSECWRMERAFFNDSLSLEFELPELPQGISEGEILSRLSGVGLDYDRTVSFGYENNGPPEQMLAGLRPMGISADEDDDNGRLLPATFLPVPDPVIELSSDSEQSQSTHSKVVFNGEPHHNGFVQWTSRRLRTTAMMDFDGLHRELDEN